MQKKQQIKYLFFYSPQIRPKSRPSPAATPVDLFSFSYGVLWEATG